MMDYRRSYSHALKAHEGWLHFAAHSHHLWPDCTREAHIKYWEDSASLADRKWGRIFGEVLPESRNHLTEHLGLSDPTSLCFAPNTHEFVARLYSCFETRPTRVVTTDSEFHSFTRQTQRLEEAGELSVTRVPVFPVETFAKRFAEECAEKNPDLIFFSQVFFNSGWAIPDLTSLVRSLEKLRSLVVVDGYHAFCAIPVDLKAIENRVFYLGGGYKYVQAGEGACFLHVPKGCDLRPRNTGWFADFEHLEEGGGTSVAYAADANRFAGATFDPSGWYRFNAVMREWNTEGLNVTSAHTHALELQARFIDGLGSSSHPLCVKLSSALLFDPRKTAIGNFLSFRLKDAQKICSRLAQAQIVTDARGEILRFGFGLYHHLSDVDAVLARVSGLR